MKQTYDIESIMFGLLNNTSALSTLSGGIYLGQRPDNSRKEDVVINTISLTQEHSPQLATSNVNIHVPDMDVKIGGVQQKVENRTRLKELAEIVLNAIRTANVSGLTISVENQLTIREPETKQHYTNIRVSWNIHS